MAAGWYHEPTHPGPAASPDPFTVQLKDINTRLQFIQSSLAAIQTFSLSEQPGGGISANLFASPNARMALPTGPLFWQLFNSLRSDVRGIDGRVATLEQSVSDLEDRVDGLDPRGWTPAGSENEASTTSAWTFHDSTDMPANGENHEMNSFGDGGPLRTSSVGLHDPNSQSEGPDSFGLVHGERGIGHQLPDSVTFRRDLMPNEDTMHHRENQIARLASQNERMQHEIDGLQDECQKRNQAWATMLYELQQSSVQASTQRAADQERIQRLEETYHELKCFKQNAIDQIAAKHEAELKVIIEQKDAEISRLKRQLHITKDHVHNETRRAIRYERLLDERDDEIAKLKASPPESEAKLEDDAASASQNEGHLVSSPFAAVGSESFPQVRWSPRPFRSSHRLPHEHERAQVWESGPAPRARFGEPGTWTSSTLQSARQDADGHRRDLRRSHSLKLLRRLALAGEGASLPAQSRVGAAASRDDSGRQRRLPLEDLAWPPTPLLPARQAGIAALYGNSDEAGLMPKAAVGPTAGDRCSNSQGVEGAGKDDEGRESARIV